MTTPPTCPWCGHEDDCQPECATWARIAECAATADHAPFWGSNPRDHEDMCVCGAIVRTVTTAEGWADHAGELRANDLRLRDVDYDRAADHYYERRTA